MIHYLNQKVEILFSIQTRVHNMNYSVSGLLTIFCFVILSCSSLDDKPEKSIVERIESEEFITIDVYKSGKIKFNDAIISTSSLVSHLQSVYIDSLTTIRVRIEDYATVGIVHDTMTRVRDASKERTRFSLFRSLEEEDRKNVEIFILKNGMVHFRGAVLHPDDLSLNFETLSVNEDAAIKITIVDKAMMGTVSDILKAAKLISKSKGEVGIYR